MNYSERHISDLAQQAGVELDELYEALEHALKSTWVKAHDMADITDRLSIDRTTGGAVIHFIDGTHRPIDLSDDEYARQSAATVKRALSSLVRSARSQDQRNEWEDQIGRLARGRVISSDSKRTLVELRDGAAGVIPESRRVKKERLRKGHDVAFVLEKIDVMNRGEVELVGSRTGADFVLQLLIDYVPEVASGDVTITHLARIDGEESICVARSSAPDVNATFSVRGVDGVRSRGMRKDLPQGEHLSIVAYSDDQGELIRRALRPDRAHAVVESSPGQFTIAGFDGEADRIKRRLRLIEKLLGVTLQIGDATQSGPKLRGAAVQVPGARDGQCKQMIRDGAKRCPNQAEAGSEYCSMHPAKVEAPA